MSKVPFSLYVAFPFSSFSSLSYEKTGTINVGGQDNFPTPESDWGDERMSVSSVKVLEREVSSAREEVDTSEIGIETTDDDSDRGRVARDDDSVRGWEDGDGTSESSKVTVADSSSDRSITRIVPLSWSSLVFVRFRYSFPNSGSMN